MRLWLAARAPPIAFAPSAPMSLRYKLQTVKWTRQRALTTGKGREGAYPTLVRVVFVFKRSAMIFAPASFSALSPKLRKGVEQRRQRALTEGKEREAAYSSACRVSFLARPSEMYFAPSAPSLLSQRLQKRVESKRQRAPNSWVGC